MATDTWYTTPEKAPHVCALTRNGDKDSGPYFETRLEYLAPFFDLGQIRANPALNTLYLSAQAIREACDTPGSPFRVVTHSSLEYEASILRSAIDECDNLSKQLAQAKADIAVLTKHIAPLIDASAQTQSEKSTVGRRKP